MLVVCCYSPGAHRGLLLVVIPRRQQKQNQSCVSAHSWATAAQVGIGQSVFLAPPSRRTCVEACRLASFLTLAVDGVACC
jgi:hypothetical protein